jgi:hypothetical protein
MEVGEQTLIAELKAELSGLTGMPLRTQVCDASLSLSLSLSLSFFPYASGGCGCYAMQHMHLALVDPKTYESGGD